MALDRKQLVQRKTKPQKPREFTLPTGDTVFLRVPRGRDNKRWEQYLRDEKGQVIDARVLLSDELLLATILINPDGTEMFTYEEVMNSAMDDLPQIDLEFLKDRAYELFGKRIGFKLLLDEDVEKNSSTTQPSE